VTVIGGGPAGLEAARRAARCGHRVRLHERGRALGGAFRMAATVHPENEPFLRFLLGEVARLPIEVRLGETIDAEAVVRSAPDAVIVATGARIATPGVPGARLPHVWTGPDLRRLLAGEVSERAAERLAGWQRWGARHVLPRLERLATPGRIRRIPDRWLPIGRRVAIVGADLAAVELAEFLATRGRRVRLIESEGEIAPEVGLKRRTEHMDRLDRLGVAVNTGIAVEEITRDGLRLRGGAGATSVAADSVVLAGRAEPATELFDALRERIPRCFAIGDCTGLGLVAGATADAAQAVAALRPAS